LEDASEFDPKRPCFLIHLAVVLPRKARELARMKNCSTIRGATARNVVGAATTEMVTKEPDSSM
jgi:hypothetical protein